MASPIAPPASQQPLVFGYTHSWIGQFAAQLMAADERVPLDYAIECAVQSYHEAGEVEPQAAADCFALAHFPETAAERWFEWLHPEPSSTTGLWARD